MATLKKYIEVIRPVFVETLEELDALWMLKRRRGCNGVTVIVPTEDIAQDMFDRAETERVEVLDEIQNYIIGEHLPAITDWRAQQNNIANLHDRIMSVKRAAGSSIVLNNGTEIVLDQGYNRGNSNTSVYLANGTVDEGGDEVDDTPEEEAKERKPQSNQDDARLGIYVSVVRSSDTLKKSAAAIMSFVRFLAKSGNQEIVEAIIPLLDPDPITCFLIIFEPGKGDRYFIDSHLIASWWESRPTMPRNALGLFQALLGKCSSFESGAYRSNNKPYIEGMRQLRSTLLQKPSAAILIPAIDKAYNDLVDNNRVRRARNILPEITHAYLKARCSPEYNLKLAQDELRLRLDLYVANQSCSYEQLLNYGASKLKVLPMINDSSLLQTTADNEANTGLMAFINTTYFLCIVPPHKSGFGGEPGYYIDASPDMEDKVTDPLADKFDALSEAPKTQIDMQEVLDNLESVVHDNNGHIPDELVAYFKQFVALNPNAPEKLRTLVQQQVPDTPSES